MTNSQNVSEDEREFLRLHAATKSFAGFCREIAPNEPPDAAHHRLFCEVADDIISGDKRRVMIFVPPGSAKSTYFSVRLPAYFVGKAKERGIICASHTSELATSFGRKVRNIVGSPEYHRLFPKTRLTQDSKAKGEWETTSGGFYFASGVGGSVTGRRADLIVADDLIRGRQDADSETKRRTTWEWWVDDLRTRLKPSGAIVLIMTRWHEDDVAGRILPENWDGESGWIEAQDGEPWFVLSIPAQAGDHDLMDRKPGEWIWPEWWSAEEWEQIKRTASRRSWNSLYQQTPAPDDGDFFRREWFRRYSRKPGDLGLYMTGDFAYTDDGGDYTELAVWGVDDHDRVYAVDWWSGQKNNLAAAKEWIRLVRRWKPRVFVGETPNQKAWEPILRRQMRAESVWTTLEWVPAPPRETKSISGKEVAARGFQALAQDGAVYFPHTDWADDVLDQLVKFPAGRYDDKVDACSMLSRYIDKTWPKRKTPKPKAPELVIGPQFMSDMEPDDAFSRRRA